MTCYCAKFGSYDVTSPLVKFSTKNFAPPLPQVTLLRDEGAQKLLLQEQSTSMLSLFDQMQVEHFKTPALR